ncbi:hypothetical protein ABHZ61_02145 [Bacteroides thetaiotaomicron]
MTVKKGTALPDINAGKKVAEKDGNPPEYITERTGDSPAEGCKRNPCSTR